MLYRFADFSFDEASGTLLSGDRRILIERRALAMLGILIRNRSRIVRKEELIEVLWGGDRISESSLPRCMNVLRSALGTRDRTSTGIIETVYGSGYRFAASLQAIEQRANTDAGVSARRAQRRDRLAILRTGSNASRSLSLNQTEETLELAELETQEGLFTDARWTLLPVVTLARACDDGDLLGRAAVAMAGTYMGIHRNDLIIGLLAEAIRAGDSIDPVLLLLLESEMEVARITRSSFTERCPNVRRLVRLGEELADGYVRTRVLLLGHRAMEGPGTLGERRDLSERALEIAREHGSARLKAGAHFACLSDSLAMADIERFESHLSRFREVANDLEEHLWLARLSLAECAHALMRGRFQLAIEHRQRAIVLLEESPEDARIVTGAHGFMIARERVDVLRSAMPAVGIDGQRDPLTEIATGIGLFYLGLREQADRLTDQLSADWFEHAPRDLVWNLFVCFCAELAFFRNDRRLAARMIPEISKCGHVLASMESTACAEPVGYFLGLAEMTLESWEKSARHFEDATGVCRALNAPGFEARVAYAWGTMLLRERGRSWRSAAREKAKFAYETAVSLGMSRLVDDASALLDRSAD